jgi:DNA-binding beta-propeller fold protein YncE
VKRGFSYGFRRLFFQLAGTGVLIFFLTSCMDDDVWQNRNLPDISLEELSVMHPVIILNEGNFMYGNASLSLYDANINTEYQDIFYRQNGIPLGDVAHSAEVHDGLLYVVMNNSGKILIMNYGKYPNLKAFDYVGKITGFNSPRYIHFINDKKAYVSDLYSKSISMVDVENRKIVGAIDVDNHSGEFYQHPTEQFLSYKDVVFTNCYSYDDKILVIDDASDKVVDSITVLKQPSSMLMDKFNKIWVICDGGYEGSDYGNDHAGLVRIDAETRTVERAFIFESDDWPSELHINGTGDTLYFINKDCWRMSVLDSSLPRNAFFKASESNLFYSLGVDPETSEVYLSDAIDHVQNGVVYRISPSGMASDTIQAGVIPGFIDFF